MLQFILSACRPNFAEYAGITQQVKQACSQNCDPGLFNSHFPYIFWRFCGRRSDSKSTLSVNQKN